MQLGLGPLYRLYEISDGWACIAAVTDTHRDALAAATGLELDALDAAHLEPWFRARSGAEAFAALDGFGVPCELCDDAFGRHIYDDPEMDARELVVHQQHPKVGRFEHFGKTIHFSETPERIWGPPPVCGQHTREIMREHGFEDAEIDKLADAKAVFEEHWVE
jgi:crotonobetainyl-CoA:carnitine CoA-transferase CaiB-like acyl-CoA transferase